MDSRIIADNVCSNHSSCRPLLRRACYLSGWGFSGDVFSDWQIAEENYCYSLSELADTVVHAVDEDFFLSFWAQGLSQLLQEKRPDVLVAWSMGAIVALELLANRPDVFHGTGLSHLLLLAPTLSFVVREEWGAGQPTGALRAMQMSFRRKPKETFEAFVGACTKNCAEEAVAGMSLIREFEEKSVAALEAQLEYLGSIDLRRMMNEDHFFSYDVSLLPAMMIIHGAQDQVIPAAASLELLAKFNFLERIELDGASHLLPCSLVAKDTATTWFTRRTALDLADNISREVPRD